MAQTLYYSRPDEWFTLNGTVTLTAGTVDSTYEASWLCDGIPGTPVLCTSGSATFRVTNTSAQVGIIAVCNHRLDAGQTITVSNGLSATITTPTPTPPNGIPLNPFTTVTPTSVSALDFAISGTSTNVLIGEIIAGKLRTLTRPTMKSDERGMGNFTRKIESEFASIPPYDEGLDARAPWKGTFLLTTSDLADVIAAYQAQRNGRRPMLVVPDASVNDAWVCFMQAPQYRPLGPAFWSVTLTFVEVPRSRW